MAKKSIEKYLPKSVSIYELKPDEAILEDTNSKMYLCSPAPITQFDIESLINLLAEEKRTLKTITFHPKDLMKYKVVGKAKKGVVGKYKLEKGNVIKST